MHYFVITDRMECLAKMERLLSELTFEMTKLPQTVLGSHQVFVDSVTTLNDLMIAIHSLKLTASEEDLNDDSVELKIELKTIDTDGFAHMVTDLNPSSSDSTICPLCGEFFKNKWKFNKHMERHEAGEKSIQCPDCEETFYIEYDLQVHKNKKHVEKKLMCSQCDYRANSLSTLERHMATHSDARPHVCDDCGRGFKDPSSLRKHMKLHTGIREHECEECGKAFVEKRDLKVHQLKMHNIGIRKHECGVEDCGLAFAEKRDLRLHMKTHTRSNQEDPFKINLFPTFQ